MPSRVAAEQPEEVSTVGGGDSLNASCFSVHFHLTVSNLKYILSQEMQNMFKPSVQKMHMVDRTWPMAADRFAY